MPQPIYYEQFVKRILVALEWAFGPEKARSLLYEGFAPYVLYDAGVRPGDILFAANCPHFQFKMPGESRFAERPPDLFFTRWERSVFGFGFPVLQTADDVAISSAAFEMRLYPLRKLDPLISPAREPDVANDDRAPAAAAAYGPPASAVVQTRPHPEMVKLLRLTGREDAIPQLYAHYGLEPPEPESLAPPPAATKQQPAVENGLISVQASPLPSLPHLSPLAIHLRDLVDSGVPLRGVSRREHARLIADRTKQNAPTLDAISKARGQAEKYLAVKARLTSLSQSDRRSSE